MSGYAYVDALVGAQIDPFALGHLSHLLDRLVLCGNGLERRATYAGHLQATEQRFYRDGVGGVRDLVEWVPVTGRHQAVKIPRPARPDPIASSLSTALEFRALMIARCPTTT